MSQLETEIRRLLEDHGVVLLDLTTSGRAGNPTIRVIADRRVDGLTIEDCAHLSRQIQYLISEKKLLISDYRLEVGSPGLDYPLTEQWQFMKNIGRLLQLRVPGEKGPKEISGRLTAVDDVGLVLTVKNAEWKPRFEEVLSAKVLPELKPPRPESPR